MCVVGYIGAIGELNFDGSFREFILIGRVHHREMYALFIFGAEAKCALEQGDCHKQQVQRTRVCHRRH